jgi:hypothetical protein
MFLSRIDGHPVNATMNMCNSGARLGYIVPFVGVVSAETTPQRAFSMLPEATSTRNSRLGQRAENTSGFARASLQRRRAADRRRVRHDYRHQDLSGILPERAVALSLCVPPHRITDGGTAALVLRNSCASHSL